MFSPWHSALSARGQKCVLLYSYPSRVQYLAQAELLRRKVIGIVLNLKNVLTYQKRDFFE